MKGRLVLAKFFQNKRGNIAIISALTIVPLLAILGGGVDVIRSTTVASQLRSTIDGAALAAANLNNTADVETVVSEFIDSNLKGYPSFLESLEVDVTSTVALNSKTVTITANGEINTFFLGLFHLDAMPVSASTTATQSITNVELSLVMDISSSMRGAKMTALQDAAKDFVDEIVTEDSEDYTSMSLVPFGGTVNIGSALFNDFATTVGGSTVNPTQTQYNKGSNVPNNDFRFTEGGNCIEYQNADFSNDDMLPANARPQVPLFWKWTNLHPWCPGDDSAIMLNSNNATTLKEHIDDMVLSDGTGMDVGTLWGVKALSPDWAGELGGDFDDRPASYADDDTMKVMVVMTDGEITNQVRPKDYTYYSTHKKVVPLNAPNTYPTSGTGGFSNSTEKNKNSQTVWGAGSRIDNGSGDALTANKARSHFRRLCSDAKANGVIVYTIGFQINTNKDADDLLLECASDSSKYYLVESLDIQSAFDAIAASVNALRITG